MSMNESAVTVISKFARVDHLHLMATNYVGLASYTMLIYDHIVTLPDEVRYMWRRNKAPIVYLFFFNRYFFPFAFIINLFAYLSPTMTPSKCKRFVRYEGACVVIGLGVAGAVLMLRVNALYQGSKRIKVLLGTLWVGMLSVYIWLLSSGYPVPRSRGEYGCSMIFDHRLKGWAALSSAAPLAFDSCIVALTLFRTMNAVRTQLASRLLRTLFADGLLYYGTIFATNLALTVMIIAAPPGLKNILGQFAEVITVTMISRLCIHLRKVGSESTILYGRSRQVFGKSSTKFNKSCSGMNSDDAHANAQSFDLSYMNPATEKIKIARDSKDAGGTTRPSALVGRGQDDAGIGATSGAQSSVLSGRTLVDGVVIDSAISSESEEEPNAADDGSSRFDSCVAMEEGERGGCLDAGILGSVDPLRNEGKEVQGVDENPTSTNVQRNPSRNTLEIIRLVWDIRHLIYS